MNINATGIIFSNVHDEELHEITSSRTMGSVPFGGRYRLIDFALSNMHNSGVTGVGVITKSNYQSLIDHVKSGKEWGLSRKRDGLFIFPPFGRLHSGYYKNKLEALSGIITFIQKSNHDYVLITDCDVICNMNWKEPLEYHIAKKADITVICYQSKAQNIPSGNQTIYSVNNQGFVEDIRIKQPAAENCSIGSNMWIIGRNFLETILHEATAHNLEDFERDIMQKRLNQYRIAAWKFSGYIQKINSIEDYFKINMDILNPMVRKDLFYSNGYIYTKVLDDIPVRYTNNAKVKNSLIADGCYIEGTVENSVLFRSVSIGKGSVINNSILMQGNTVKENVQLDYVISDKNVTFRDARKLMGYEKQPIYIRKGSEV
ncbi:MAG: glucose-phosphate adenylyltransferase subunit GlgD [Herbinix sp.]|jgi:glucose-1-phosphate adenylyltransferase|nr:glucose-phosphate adenylyltransferase subunit GlgD [Herbinix sp.]